jgi:hypothetical protein
MIMPDFIEDYLFAPCGMNCLACYVHLKTKKPCDGCLGNDKNKPERCRTCEIKNCCIEKGIQYCFECNEYPCKRIKNLEKSYNKRYGASLIENSRMVKEKRIAYFQQTEAQKWTCQDCGGIISIHDKICSECHKKWI